MQTVWTTVRNSCWSPRPPNMTPSLWDQGRVPPVWSNTIGNTATLRGFVGEAPWLLRFCISIISWQLRSIYELQYMKWICRYGTPQLVVNLMKAKKVSHAQTETTRNPNSSVMSLWSAQSIFWRRHGFHLLRWLAQSLSYPVTAPPWLGIVHNTIINNHQLSSKKDTFHIHIHT